MAKECNFCGGTTFQDFNTRKEVLCAKCHSLERHRLVKYTLEQFGYLTPPPENRRCLHPAPEPSLSGLLANAFGQGYTCCDLFPEKYPASKCLKLEMPGGFGIFPDEYFDLIVHNHWLEHIPGDYHAHLAQLHRILKKGGRMIFTAPVFMNVPETRQGGEFMKTDAERKAAFRQEDHYKLFGKDFLRIFEWLKCDFKVMDIPKEIREKLGGNDMIFVYTRL